MDIDTSELSIIREYRATADPLVLVDINDGTLEWSRTTSPPDIVTNTRHGRIDEATDPTSPPIPASSPINKVTDIEAAYTFQKCSLSMSIFTQNPFLFAAQMRLFDRMTDKLNISVPEHAFSEAGSPTAVASARLQEEYDEFADIVDGAVDGPQQAERTVIVRLLDVGIEQFKAFLADRRHQVFVDRHYEEAIEQTGTSVPKAFWKPISTAPDDNPFISDSSPNQSNGDDSPSPNEQVTLGDY